VFVEIVTESKTCHIYKAVLLIIKVAVRDASRVRTYARTRDATKHLMKSNQQHNTVKLDI
jgi:hypothetical protein